MSALNDALVAAKRFGASRYKIDDELTYTKCLKRPNRDSYKRSNRLARRKVNAAVRGAARCGD